MSQGDDQAPGGGGCACSPRSSASEDLRPVLARPRGAQSKEKQEARMFRRFVGGAAIGLAALTVACAPPPAELVPPQLLRVDASYPCVGPTPPPQTIRTGAVLAHRRRPGLLRAVLHGPPAAGRQRRPDPTPGDRAPLRADVPGLRPVTRRLAPSGAAPQHRDRRGPWRHVLDGWEGANGCRGGPRLELVGHLSGDRGGGIRRVSPLGLSLCQSSSRHGRREQAVELGVLRVGLAARRAASSRHLAVRTTHRR